MQFTVSSLHTDILVFTPNFLQTLLTFFATALGLMSLGATHPLSGGISLNPRYGKFGFDYML